MYDMDLFVVRTYRSLKENVVNYHHTESSETDFDFILDFKMKRGNLDNLVRGTELV